MGIANVFKVFADNVVIRPIERYSFTVSGFNRRHEDYRPKVQSFIAELRSNPEYQKRFAADSEKAPLMCMETLAVRDSYKKGMAVDEAMRNVLDGGADKKMISFAIQEASAMYSRRPETAQPSSQPA